MNIHLHSASGTLTESERSVPVRGLISLIRGVFTDCLETSDQGGNIRTAPQTLVLASNAKGLEVFTGLLSIVSTNGGLAVQNKCLTVECYPGLGLGNQLILEDLGNIWPSDPATS